MVAQPRQVLAEAVGASEVVGPELPLRWNVAPSTELYALAVTAEGRRLGTLVWGFVPWWSPSPQGPRAGKRPINARAETMASSRQFADSVARRRCLVVADGFYEWEPVPGVGRQPWFFSRADGQPIALAALWDRWRPRPEAGGGESLSTCAIVTTAANADMGGIHDRMPVILDLGDWDRWLDPAEHDPAAATRLAVPGDEGRLIARRVSRLVNHVANDGPELLTA